MDAVLHSLLIERLRTSRLEPAAARLAEQACDAPSAGGDVPPAAVWLKSIGVEGFRGIGPRATPDPVRRRPCESRTPSCDVVRDKPGRQAKSRG